MQSARRGGRAECTSTPERAQTRATTTTIAKPKRTIVLRGGERGCGGEPGRWGAYCDFVERIGLVARTLAVFGKAALFARH